mmetsp:Transcript_14217/g.39413  ORF Transcript_14217/g.39413 Transcript_14217/m.39413 type:complete len:121 (+) Transcript_14217:2774-3136(+)
MLSGLMLENKNKNNNIILEEGSQNRHCDQQTRDSLQMRNGLAMDKAKSAKETNHCLSKVLFGEFHMCAVGMKVRVSLFKHQVVELVSVQCFLELHNIDAGFRNLQRFDFIIELQNKPEVI